MQLLSKNCMCVCVSETGLVCGSHVRQFASSGAHRVCRVRMCIFISPREATSNPPA